MWIEQLIKPSDQIIFEFIKLKSWPENQKPRQRMHHASATSYQIVVIVINIAIIIIHMGEVNGFEVSYFYFVCIHLYMYVL